MHYYQFNIGDYHSHTSRLSIYEDIAYRRILDLYYLTERPLNGCSTDVAREIGMLDFKDDVDYVLKKFFEEKNGEWINKRCDAEIKAYQNKKKSAVRAGKASGKARKAKSEQTLNDRSADVEPTINQEPLTINHKTNTKPNTAKPSIPYQEIVDLYHEKLPELPKVIKLTKTRQGYIRQRWFDDDMNDIGDWGRFFNHVRKSDFLMGRTQSNNGRPPFRADLEWLTKPANFIKIAEDKYHV